MHAANLLRTASVSPTDSRRRVALSDMMCVCVTHAANLLRTASVSPTDSRRRVELSDMMCV